MIELVVLEGRHVRLEPLSDRHVSALAAVSQHPEIWRWMPMVLDSEEQLASWARIGEGMVAAGSGLVFATVLRATGNPVGSSSFLAAAPDQRGVEIGSTWITPAHQRTTVNAETKYLMLRHAFEDWGCIRVEFKTDSLNARSRAALAGIGAREEGTLRNHRIMPDGRYRHSVYFSITDDEWPAVAQGLLARIDASGAAG